MIAGTPVDLDACPTRDGWNRCACEKCAVCGWAKHMAVHGGVIGQPGMIFGHAFVEKQQTMNEERK